MATSRGPSFPVVALRNSPPFRAIGDVHAHEIAKLREDLSKIARLSYDHLTGVLHRLKTPPAAPPQLESLRPGWAIRRAIQWREAVLPEQHEFEKIIASLQRRLARKLDDFWVGDRRQMEARFHDGQEAQCCARILYYLAFAWHGRSSERHDVLSYNLLRRNRSLAWIGAAIRDDDAPRGLGGVAAEIHDMLLETDKLFGFDCTTTYRRTWRPKHVFNSGYFDQVFAVVDTITLQNVPRGERRIIVSELVAYFKDGMEKTTRHLVKLADKKADDDWLDNPSSQWANLCLLYPKRLLGLVAELVRKRRPEAENLPEALMKLLAVPQSFSLDESVSFYNDSFADCFDLGPSVAGRFSPTQQALIKHRAELIFSETTVWTPRQVEQLALILLTDFVVAAGTFQSSTMTASVLPHRKLRDEVLAFLQTRLAVEGRTRVVKRWMQFVHKNRVFTPASMAALPAAATALLTPTKPA